MSAPDDYPAPTHEQQVEAALRESEERYRTLVEQIPAVVYLAALDGNSTTSYLAPQSARIIGYTCQDMEADPRFWDKAIHPEDRERVLAAVTACQRDGTPLSIEYRFHAKDGRQLWLHDEAAIVTFGKERCLQGVMVDISDRKRTEEAMARHRDMLVREVHHRIKNHLQGITGLLRNRAAEKPEIATVLDTAIGQINTVAQVYGLQGRVDFQRVRLCDLLAMAAEGTAGPVAVNCRREPSDRTAPLAEAEAVPVALVVNELIVNAVKHLDPPDAGRPVTVVTEIGAAVVTVTIRNAPTRLPPGFDFATGRGCGTGLELVRALLPRQGAALDFRQEGDTVVTTLRLAPPVVRIQPIEPAG